MALISKLDPADGVVVYTRQHKERLEADGHAVKLLHFSTGNTGAGAGEVHLPHSVRTQGYTLPAAGAYRLLKEQLAGFEPRIIHAHLPVSPLDFLLPRLARELGAALVGTYHHGWDYRPTKFGLVAQAITRAYAPALARYDRVIVFGPRLAGELTRLGVAGPRVAQVPNGVNVHEYAPGESSFRLPGKVRATYMGRMTPDKNVTELVETFVEGAHPDLVLTLVGAGPLYEGIRERFSTHPGLDLRGYVADAEVRKEIWRGSDVVVLPSPIEGLSLSLLEGMASGCMPVATDVGEHAMVLAGVGHVMDPRTIRRDLATAWRWLSDNPAEVAARGESARARAQEFSAEVHWRRLYDLYEGAVPGFRS